MGDSQMWAVTRTAGCISGSIIAIILLMSVAGFLLSGCDASVCYGRGAVVDKKAAPCPRQGVCEVGTDNATCYVRGMSISYLSKEER